MELLTYDNRARHSSSPEQDPWRVQSGWSANFPMPNETCHDSLDEPRNPSNFDFGESYQLTEVQNLQTFSKLLSVSDVPMSLVISL
jgi:hypothetical protein